jgi:predicted anti-sigma-YlaC factor YlaD
VRHPSPDALLELHFDEALPGERAPLEEHLRGCPECRATVSELRQLEQELGPGPDDAPPRDGLERVLARVADIRPARKRGAEWALAAGPCAAAMLAGAWAIRAGSERLNALGMVSGASLGPLSGEALGLSLAAVGVVALGALVTLALAPVLILESHGRS